MRYIQDMFPQRLSIFIQAALSAWFLCVIGFFSTLVFATKGFHVSIYDTTFGNSPVFLLLLGSFVLLGGVFFLIGILFWILKLTINLHQENILKNILLFFSLLFIMPFYIIFSLIRKGIGVLQTSQKDKFSLQRYFFFFGQAGFVILILLPIWLMTYFTAGVIFRQMIISKLGYASVQEAIVGTGSMYPTFPKSDKKTNKEKYEETVATANFIPYPNGISFFGKRYLGHTLERGDIITFTNKATQDITKKEYGVATGFMKRLIGMPGDTVQLREGIVYLNGKPLKEPYTAQPRSTFAEDFLSECKLITVPPHHIFAMGDNRKGSGDSREIGFVDISAIDYVLPLENQKGVWDKNWRNTSQDFAESSKIKLNKIEYLSLLNAKREEAGVKSLIYQPKLEESAILRGKNMLQFDDFSWEATRSGYTMDKAMQDVGYSNTSYGEVPTQGYFEADELLDNQFQFPKSKDFLLDKDFQEIGIAEVEGEINGCPTQVIVQHVAGYIPPNYTAEVVDSWDNALKQLKNIAPGWQDLKNNTSFYNEHRGDVDRINSLISQRISAMESIVVKMHANQWLSVSENEYTQTTDEILSKEQNDLADKLNR